MRDVPATRRSRVWKRALLWTLVALWLGTAYWQTNKPLPAGVHTDSPWYPISARDVTFIADITSADAYGRQNTSQAIFDETLNVIQVRPQIHRSGLFPVQLSVRRRPRNVTHVPSAVLRAARRTD